MWGNEKNYETQVQSHISYLGNIHEWRLKVSRSRKKLLPTNKFDEFVFVSWWLKNAWNLKSKFKERKTNLSVHFLGEVKTQQFFFEIYWPLTISDYIQYPCLNIISADISCKSGNVILKMTMNLSKLKIAILQQMNFNYLLYLPYTKAGA